MSEQNERKTLIDEIYAALEELLRSDKLSEIEKIERIQRASKTLNDGKGKVT